jgi:error-prone DNA polymerase
MEAISAQLVSGMIKNGIDEDVAMRIFKQLTAFADYGFPESHSASFALLVYVSSFLKVYYPEEFYCALLNAQPMGFYSPASIIYEGQRRGVEFLDVDVNCSHWDCTVENGSVRLGFSYVKNLGGNAEEAIENAFTDGPFTSLRDFVFRTELDQRSLRQLALVGAFSCFGLSRRQALWQVMSLEGHSQIELPIENIEQGEKMLPEMEPLEFLISDFAGLDLSTGPHLMKFVREQLKRRRIKSAAELEEVDSGAMVSVAGVVIIRQRPMTAKGFIFITLEDETGFVNVVVKPNMAKQCGKVVSRARALLVEGELEKRDGVINVIGARFSPLEFLQDNVKLKSRDFH